jgi:Protein of unknown function (DUF1552)
MRRSRRDFLGTLTAGAALAPFVPYLNREAEAQAKPPVRVLLLFTANGTVPSRYWPTGGETDFTFPAGQITEPLAPFRSKMIYAMGMKRPRAGGGGHESALRTMWTGAGQTGSGGGFGGYAAGPSVDQIIAKNLPQGLTTFQSLQFGVQHDGPGANPSVLTVMTYAASNQPLAPESNPYTMFNRLMIGSSGQPTGITPDQLNKIRARRQSVIDLVRDDLRALAPKIDRSDRVKIDQHVTSLQAIEKRLNMPVTPGAGSSCSATPPRMGIDLKANESFPELLGIQSSLAVSALACDRTRVASLQWSRSFSQVRHTWVGVSAEHHTLSHMTSAQNQMDKYKIDRWYNERMAEFLHQMDSVQEGAGTLLDNTMIVYGNDLAEGAPHSVAPAIAWVAGSGGGKLKTGRFLQLPNYDWTQLLVTACHVMGVTNVNQVGELGKQGDIPTLLA